MSESTVSVTIIFVFTFIPLILSEFARKDSLPSVDDFFLFGRRMPITLSFFTIYGTWFSTFAVIGSSAHFYSNGPVYMTAFAWNVLFAVCIFSIGRRLWFYGKTNGYITPVDFFQDIYGSKPLTILVTFVFLLFTLPYIQIQFSSGAYLIEIATNGRIPWQIAGLIFYTIMVVYMWAGGLRAVALIDVFFGILVFTTMLGTGIYLASEAGGTKHILEILGEKFPEHMIVSPGGSFDNVILWLSMFIVTPLGAIMSPPIWIRCYANKTEKSFKLLPFIIAFASAGYIGCALAGNAGKILEPGLEHTDMLIPTLLTEYGSQILTTLFFCGFAAASLSTANSQIHALAAIYTIDVHKKFIMKDATDNKLLKIAKWSVLLFSAMTYLMMIKSSSLIINTGLLALSGTLQILVPAAGALFWKKSTAQGAFWGLSGGIVTLLLFFFLFDMKSSYCGCIALVINLLIFISVSAARGNNAAAREKIIHYRAAFAKRDE